MASSTPMNGVSPLSDMVNSMTTMISTDVHHEGMASVSHMMAAKTKIAMTRCCTALSPSMPKVSVGRKAMTNARMVAIIILR